MINSKITAEVNAAGQKIAGGNGGWRELEWRDDLELWQGILFSPDEESIDLRDELIAQGWRHVRFRNCEDWELRKENIEIWLSDGKINLREV